MPTKTGLRRNERYSKVFPQLRLPINQANQIVEHLTLVEIRRLGNKQVAGLSVFGDPCAR